MIVHLVLYLLFLVFALFQPIAEPCFFIKSFLVETYGFWGADFERFYWIYIDLKLLCIK